MTDDTSEGRDRKTHEETIKKVLEAIQLIPDSSISSPDWSRDPAPKSSTPASLDNLQQSIGQEIATMDPSAKVLVELRKTTSPNWKEEIFNALKSMERWEIGLLLVFALILFPIPFPDRNAVFLDKLTILTLVFLFLFSSKTRGDKGPLSEKERDWLTKKLRLAGELARNPNQEESVQVIYNEVSSFLKNNNKLTDEGRALIKSAFLSVLVPSYATSGKHDCTLKFYDELSEFRKQFPSNELILVAWTLASPSLTLFYAKNNQIEKARKIYDDLVNLNPVYSEDKRFLKSLCVASVNMILAYGQAKEVKEAREIYDRLVALSEQDPEDKEVRGSTGQR